MEELKLNFGQAIEALKEGKKVAREGWNGKGMFIFLVKGNINGSTFEELRGTRFPALISGVNINNFEKGDFGTVTSLPRLNMKAADNSIVNGWFASQTDILAEDWLIVE